jgi:hypothetical protein
MGRLVKLLLFTLAFGALGFVFSLVPQKNAGGAVATNVNVVNAPLPVTGAVNASIVGVPTVNIGNTPTVGLAPGTTVGITGGNLNFSNTLQTPVFVRNVDNTDANPFLFSFCTSTYASSCTGQSPAIPTTTSDGRTVRLAVINQVEFITGQPANQIVDVHASFQGNYVTHSFNVPQSSNSFSGVLNTNTHIYVDPGTIIYGTFELSNSGTNISVTLSGYLLTQ